MHVEVELEISKMVKGSNAFEIFLIFLRLMKTAKY